MVLAEVAAVADEYWIPYYNVECRVIKGDNKPLSQVSHNPLGSLPFSPSHHSLPFPFPRLIPIPIPSLPPRPAHACLAPSTPVRRRYRQTPYSPHRDISSLLTVQHPRRRR